MPPIVTTASETRLSDLTGVHTRIASPLLYHRPRLVRLPVPGPGASSASQPTKGLPQLPQTLPPSSMPPLRRPQLQLQPCPMDNVRRMFAEPFVPGSLVPLSPPPTKRFAKRAVPTPSPLKSRITPEFPTTTRAVRERSISNACSIVPSPSGRQWGLDINSVAESLLEEQRTILGHTTEKPEEEVEGDNDDGEEQEGDVTSSLLAPPQLDLALPSPTFSPFSFDDMESYTASLTSTPALSSTSLTSTPSTATFSLYSGSGSESGRDSRRSSRESSQLSTLDEQSLADTSSGSHFSDDDDDDSNGDNGQHTPKRRTPHPSTFENFLPPPLPILKAVTTLPPIFTDHGPLCSSPTSPTTTYLVDTDTDTPSSGPPSPTDNRAHKRRKRHGRLMSIEEIHLVKQSFMPTDVVDAEDYWI